MARALQKRELPEGTILAAYRVVTTHEIGDQALLPSFVTNKAKGCQPRGREEQIPEIWDSLSMFMSLEAVRAMRAAIAAKIERAGGEVRMGGYVAELRLEGGTGIEYEDLKEPNGHISIWAPALQLVRCVVDIHPA